MRAELEAIGIAVNDAPYAGRPHVVLSKTYPLSMDGWSALRDLQRTALHVLARSGFVITDSASGINKDWTARIVRVSAIGPGQYDKAHPEYRALDQLERAA